MKVDFSFTKSGLSLTVRNTSREVPENSKYSWDFGDYTEPVEDEMKVTHEYTEEGFYDVTLSIVNPDGKKESLKQSVGLSTKPKTTLSDSIYNIIDSRIPEELLPYLSKKDKRVFIEKWQLYIQPLVNHCIPIEEVYNEFAYEALENQLVVEAAAYDWLVAAIMNLMRSISDILEDSTSEGDSEGEVGENGRVKKIKTGPTEVEWFDPTLTGDSASSLAKTITSAIQPGGIIDTLKENLCMLAERVEVYLPICTNKSNPFIPRVVNRRNPGKLGGPNPTYPIK